jgi:hypothetical protein
MSLDQLISVTITTQAAGIPVPAFGTTLIAGQTAGWLTGSAGDLIRFYATLVAVAADFGPTAPEYLAAIEAFGQNPAPTLVAVGKVPAPVQGVTTLAFSVALIAANVVNLTVNGVAIAPVTFATSNAATLTALAAAITAMNGVASAVSDGTSTITITGGVGVALAITGAGVTLGVSQATTTVTITTPAVVWSTGIAAIRAISNAWYGLTITDRAAGSLLDVAGWTEANNIFFAGCTGDANVLTTAVNDVCSLAKLKSLKRTLLIYHGISNEYPAAAWLALMLSYPPGSANWMYKVLANVTAESSPTFTETMRGNALGKNCNVYSVLNGTAMTERGICAGGQFADITVGIDWIKANLQADILTIQMSNPKIAYTDAGAAVFESAFRKRIALAQNAGIVATVPAPVFGVPKVADQAATDRGNRNFPGITVTGNLQGAIDTVAFSLTLVP